MKWDTCQSTPNRRRTALLLPLHSIFNFNIQSCECVFFLLHSRYKFHVQEYNLDLHEFNIFFFAAVISQTRKKFLSMCFRVSARKKKWQG
jgi:hypothetical protein